MHILYHPDILLHCVPELQASELIPAYESPSRIRSITSSLQSAGRKLTTIPLDVTAAENSALRVHTEDYINHLRTIYASWVSADLIGPKNPKKCVLPECFPHQRLALGRRAKPPKDLFARAGYYAFDLCAGIGAGSWESIIASAELARRAVEMLVEFPETSVFALCRPPGHHCSSDLAGGYCYLNNAAIAVRELMARIDVDSEMITILDIDFHHGNGTQDTFYSERNPCYISIHGRDEYPYYAGFEDEIGEGEGEGYNLNLPLPGDGSTVLEVYLEALEIALIKVREVETKWLVVSLGFDTFWLDPIGKFKLETEDYRIIARKIGELGLPTCIILEGGYAVEQLGENTVVFLEGFDEGMERARVGNNNVNGVNGTRKDSENKGEEEGEGDEEWETV